MWAGALEAGSAMPGRGVMGARVLKRERQGARMLERWRRGARVLERRRQGAWGPTGVRCRGMSSEVAKG